MILNKYFLENPSSATYSKYPPSTTPNNRFLSDTHINAHHGTRLNPSPHRNFTDFMIISFHFISIANCFCRSHFIQYHNNPFLENDQLLFRRNCCSIFDGVSLSFQIERVDKGHGWWRRHRFRHHDLSVVLSSITRSLSVIPMLSMLRHCRQSDSTADHDHDHDAHVGTGTALHEESCAMLCAMVRLRC